MTADELEELRRENKALKARVDAMSTQIDEIKDYLIGEHRELTEEEVEETRNLFDRIGAVEGDVQELNQTARAAVAASDARADGGTPSKKELALTKARNRLVVNAASTSRPKQKMRFTAVQEAVEQAEIRYQTVKDAAADLAAKWTAIEKTKDENGNWVLTLQCNQLEKELIYVVEEDLGRDDLAKRLISKSSGMGAK